MQLKASLRGHDFATQVQMLAPENSTRTPDKVQAAAARGIAGSGGGLPHGDRIQRSFGGYDLSNVQAHSDATATSATAAMGADAYATGNHIVLGQGGQDLHTVAHEAAHVVQQRHGVALSGGVGKAGDPYEQQADAVADLVVQGKSAEGLLGQMAGGDTNHGIQMRESEPVVDTPRGAAAEEKSNESAIPDAAAKGTDQLPPGLPQDFGSESVLRTWIGLFNQSLMAMKEANKRQWIAKLKLKQWGDDSGLNYELLAAAAANEPAPSAKRGAKAQALPKEAQVAAPGPILNARILAMLSRGNGSLYNGVEGYSSLCLQFSAKMTEQMGAKRADGSSAMSEKRGSAKGSLTPLYRGKRLSAVPKTLPAGYQVCILSRPEWGFTEVGNHWFITAGDGFFLDNVMGVTTATQMEASLAKTTAAQWVSRVIDPVQKNELRAAMGEKFAKAHGLEQYRQRGRTANEQKKKIGNTANAAYKEACTDETAGIAAVKAVVAANPELYTPRIWVVEPTTRADGGGQ